ncbi:uncharacterized protein [Haliotis cracherodii]|uniref:uncharacterized protein n=1 Tax=Haliotis cracherodii TaxID=6455 RepID=UPI0039E79B90
MVNKTTLLQAFAILVLPVFLVTVIFNILAGLPDTGAFVFLTTTTAISDRFISQITPVGFTFIIWGLVYVWQLVWIIYELTLLCRKSASGEPLFLKPILLTTAFFGIYILSLVLNVFWLFMFDRELIGLAFVTLAGISVTLYICLGLSYLAMYKNRFILSNQSRRVDIVLISIFVHNGLALYAAWTTVATFINMAIVITYQSLPPIDPGTASTIALGFLAAVIIIYVAVDLSVFDKYTRYTFTPYPVVIWAFVGIIARGYNLLDANTIFVLVLLALTVVAFLVKIALAIYRAMTQPLFPPPGSGPDETKGEEVTPEEDMEKATSTVEPSVTANEVEHG